MINVSVVLGDASADICNKVSKLRDDFNLVPFANLGELFRESEYTQYPINRVVVSSKVLEYGDVDDNIIRLRNLIRSQSEFSSVVFLCKEETDADLEGILIKEFTESECAVLSIFSSSVNSIIEFLSKDISVLRCKYGYKSEDISDSSSILDDSVEYKNEQLVEDTSNEVLEDVTEVTKKKPSFLDALFGKSKKNEVDASDSKDDTSDSDFIEVNSGTSEESNSNDASDDEDGSIDTDATEYDSAVETNESEDNSKLSENYDNNSSSLATEDVAEENSEEVSTSHSTTRAVLNEVKSQPELFEVDDDDNNLLSATDEGNYRDKSVKVVERVVEKVVEKVVTVPSETKSVFNKASKRLVLVTGDRRAGTTTFAYNLAKVFSKKMRVLYVDCDIVRHGILTMIDYDEFKKNDAVTKEAMRLCNTWDDIQRGIFRVSRNFDMLTSDYGTEVSKKDLEGILDVIADYYTSYDFVVLDIPLSNLDCACGVLSFAKPIIVSEGTLGGLLSLVSEGEIGICSNVQSRYMNILCKKGTMVFTKVEPSFNAEGIKLSVGNILDLDYPWLDMRCISQPVLDEKSLGYILEV